MFEATNLEQALLMPTIAAMTCLANEFEAMDEAELPVGTGLSKSHLTKLR